MLERRLRLGTYFGIDLFVHWTFGLLVAYLVATSWHRGAVGIGYSVARLFGVFLCVTLHEYGHALAARAFHVPTIDITLLPIGGVARLKHMPRVPWQELLVAIAGPAVNVVIVLMILLGIGIYAGLGVAMDVPMDRQLLIDLDTLLTVPSVWGFVVSMLIINTMLVLFNMIPAFPMDGGRVLRSVLAMMTSYRKATFIASRLGLVCAVLMALWALQIGEFMPLLIAGFIAFAGMNEARQVDVMESVRGLQVSDVMTMGGQAVSMDTPLSLLVTQWRSLSATELPVVSSVDSVVGMVRISEVAKAIRQDIDPLTPVGQIADHSVPAVRLGEELESVVLGGGRQNRLLPVVDDSGRLIGTLDLDSVLARGQLSRAFGQSSTDISPHGSQDFADADNPYAAPEVPPRFDAFS